MAKSLTMYLPMHCNNEYLDDVPTVVKATITAKDIAWIKKVMKALKELDAFHMDRFDGCDFGDYKNEDGDIDELGTYQEAEEFRNICTYLRVYKDGDICYRGYVKHINDAWESDQLSFKDLTEAWKVLTAKDDELPLLLNSLKSDLAKETLKERMTPCHK